MSVVRRQRFSPQYVAVATRLLSTLSHATRLEIVLALAQGEATVGDLCDHLGLPQSGVSHHLRILRDVALVRDRREGQFVVYSLEVETWRAVAHGFFDHLLAGADSVTLQDFTLRRDADPPEPGTPVLGSGLE